MIFVIYFLLFYGFSNSQRNQTNQRKKCVALKVFRNHMQKYVKSEGNQSLLYYVPGKSCFLCTEPMCDFSNDSCTPISISTVIPVYNNLLEFGMFVFDELPELEAIITMSEECYYQIYETVSMNCNESSSSKPFNFLTSSHKDTCFFNKASQITVQYRYHNLTKLGVDGMPVILPCSPGGYAVDPLSGHFITGRLCREFYRDPKFKIAKALSTYYDGMDDNFTFPYYTEGELLVRKPVFISKNGTAKSALEMAPERIACTIIVIRGGCLIAFVKLALQDIKQDPRCIEEYNRRKEQFDKERTELILKIDPPVVDDNGTILNGNGTETPEDHIKRKEEDSESNDHFPEFLSTSPNSTTTPFTSLSSSTYHNEEDYHNITGSGKVGLLLNKILCPIWLLLTSILR